MATFRDVATRVRTAAAELGIRTSTSHLNDAIAVACFGEIFNAVLAAEAAGKLPPVPTVPPHITQAAREYHIDSHALGQALHIGIHPRATYGRGGVLDAVDWLAVCYGPQLDKLAASELVGLADENVMRAVFANEHSAIWHMAFADWVVAEGRISVNRKLVSCAELLRQRRNVVEQQYLDALSPAPLRLYLVESVAPGCGLALRDLCAVGDQTVTVLERSLSAPRMQGETIAARLVAFENHYALAAGVLPFTRALAHKVTSVVRSLGTAPEISRAIRSAWLEHFDLRGQATLHMCINEGDLLPPITKAILNRS